MSPLAKRALRGTNVRGAQHETQANGSHPRCLARAAGGPDAFDEKKCQSDEEKPGELVDIIGVGHFARFAGFQFVEAIQERIQVNESRPRPHVSSSSGFYHGHQHALIQCGDDGLSSGILLVSRLTAIAVELGNGAARLTRHACCMHHNASCCRFISPSKGIVFVVFSIGQYHDDLARLALRIKRGDALFDGSTDGRALDGDGFWSNGV